MNIKRLVIENFKSIERIELKEPNPFTVFVGPNGSGKSNIFEALEFVNLRRRISDSDVVSLFGGANNFLRRQCSSEWVHFECIFESFTTFQNASFARHPGNGPVKFIGLTQGNPFPEPVEHIDYKQFYNNFSRLFIGNKDSDKLPFNDDRRLSLSASNLEKVLRRILTNPILRDEIFEWLELFVPGFKAVEVDDRNELHWFENSSPAYFTKDLISDGTYNILALLTAVYQSDDKPQFLCIEEPENGLHPQVAGEFADFIRIMCEERGHYIWLNTHSESIVRRLRKEEIILVNKRDGATQIKQIADRNLYDLPMDEAWLTGALGGGLPW